MSEVFLHISAGSGPKECHWVVAKLAAAFVKEAKSQDIKCEIILDDEESTNIYPSAIVKLTGKITPKFSRPRIGTICWIGQSPYRKNHKRRNWFVGVRAVNIDKADIDIHERDIRYQAMKASGPGGQHVNATQSAVRATHIPTGISVVAREERSQHANKRLCRIKLALIFANRKSESQSKVKHNTWQQNQTLERGNAVRTYEGTKFRLKT